MNNTMMITNAQIVMADAVTGKDGWIIIKDGKFNQIGTGKAPDHKDMHIVNALGNYIFPGLIDLQINGGGGLVFNECRNDINIQTALESNLATGTTTLLPTLITDTEENLTRQVRLIATTQAPLQQMIAGIHVEGPFFNVEKRGMHAYERILKPDITFTEKLVESAQGKLKIMTLAPETEGGLAVIKYLTENGVIASLGHSAATEEETKLALAAGLGMATHLFNAMPTVHHRMTGPIPTLLSSKANLGIIADGIHIAPSVLKMCFQMPDVNYFLVSDGISPHGTNLESFRYNNTTIKVNNGACYDERGVLAGSATPLFNGVIRAYQELGCSLTRAVNMASLKPAEILGIQESHGSVAIGKAADFLIVDQDLFKLEAVYKNGQKVQRVYNL